MCNGSIRGPDGPFAVDVQQSEINARTGISILVNRSSSRKVV
jgi:hypothetical protein